MLIFGEIIIKSKKIYTHFYTLSEQTPRIAIVNNKRKKNERKINQWINP